MGHGTQIPGWLDPILVARCDTTTVAAGMCSYVGQFNSRVEEKQKKNRTKRLLSELSVRPSIPPLHFQSEVREKRDA